MLLQLTLIIAIVSLVIQPTLLIDVIRKDTGDEEPFFKCDQGTFIIRDDSTHSFYCAKSLIEAGCNLRFVNSHNVGFIRSNRAYTTTFGITSSAATICPVNFKPYIGELYLQDYPTNLFKPVWTNTTGVEKVNETLKFSYINENMIRFEVSTKDWKGILLKIFIHCVDSTNRLYMSDYPKRCVIVKYEGKVNYPLSITTFDPEATTTTTTTTKTSTISTTSPNINGTVGYLKSTESSDTMYLLIIILCGCVFFVGAIFITTAIICYMNKQKKRHVLEDGRPVGKPNEKAERIVHKKPKSKQRVRFNRTKKRKEDELVIEPSVRGDPRLKHEASNINKEHMENLEDFGEIYIGELNTNDLSQEDVDIMDNKLKSYGRNNKKASRVKGIKNINFQNDQNEFEPRILEENNMDSNHDNLSANFPPPTPVHRPKAISSITGNRQGRYSNNGSVSGSIPSHRSLDTPTRFRPYRRSSQNIDNENVQDDFYKTSSKIYTKGHFPNDHPEDPNATSESIEAMFSFSNELIDVDDENGEELETSLKAITETNSRRASENEYFGKHNTDIPKRKTSTPSRQYGTPTHKYSTPRQNDTPKRQYGTPTRQYGTSPRQKVTPSHQNETPTRQYGTPTKQNGTQHSNVAELTRKFSNNVSNPNSPHKYKQENHERQSSINGSPHQRAYKNDVRPPPHRQFSNTSSILSQRLYSDNRRNQNENVRSPPQRQYSNTSSPSQRHFTGVRLNEIESPQRQYIDDIATQQHDIDGSYVYVENDDQLYDLDTIANAFPEDEDEYNELKTTALQKKNPLYSQQGTSMMMF